MKNAINTVLLTLALSTSSLSVNASTMSSQDQWNKKNPPQTVYSVDINKYQGKWFEIARKPTIFQFFCFKNVIAKYKLNDDGTIKVVNKCRGIFNDKIKAVGKATVGEETSKLTVNFIPKGFEWLAPAQQDSNYWVLALDDDYQHVMVGSPDRRYLWILSRTQTMPENIYQNYVNLAQNQGYDISNVRKTRQQ